MPITIETITLAPRVELPADWDASVLGLEAGQPEGATLDFFELVPDFADVAEAMLYIVEILPKVDDTAAQMANIVFQQADLKAKETLPFTTLEDAYFFTQAELLTFDALTLKLNQDVRAIASEAGVTSVLLQSLGFTPFTAADGTTGTETIEVETGEADEEAGFLAESGEKIEGGASALLDGLIKLAVLRATGQEATTTETTTTETTTTETNGNGSGTETGNGSGTDTGTGSGTGSGNGTGTKTGPAPTKKTTPGLPPDFEMTGPIPSGLTCPFIGSGEGCGTQNVEVNLGFPLCSGGCKQSQCAPTRKWEDKCTRCVAGYTDGYDAHDSACDGCVGSHHFYRQAHNPYTGGLFVNGY